MNIADYTAHMLTEMSKAHESGDKARALQLLDTLIEVLRKKREQIAKET